MPTKPKHRKPKTTTPQITPPLTADERVRMARYGITEEEVARDPGLRFVGVFADMPDFFEPIKQYYRETRGRELFPEDAR